MEDHRHSKHTFRISWEGFNFIWVHSPPTAQDCQDAYISARIYVCLYVCVCMCVHGCVYVHVFMHMHSIPEDGTCFFDGFWGLKLLLGSHGHTHKHSCTMCRSCQVPSLGCKQPLWWKTFLHSGGSYKPVASMICVSLSLSPFPPLTLFLCLSFLAFLSIILRCELHIHEHRQTFGQKINQNKHRELGLKSQT